MLTEEAITPGDRFDIGKEMGADPFSQEKSTDDMKNPFLEEKKPEQPESFNPGQPFSVSQPVQQPLPQNDLTNKNIEIVSTKIDALKAELESMNQRLVNIEALAKKEQESEKIKRYRAW